MSSASSLTDPSPSVSPAIPCTVHKSHPLTQVVLTFDHHPVMHSTGNTLPGAVVKNTSGLGLLRGLARRWRRERRRRKVGRAYDMALEIARVLPSGSRVLDVGCGNGYIAHHLSAMVNASVMGIDLGESTEAPIDYRRFNGTRFPVESNSFDGVLLCYVLHHAQKLDVVLDELSRVLRAGGRAVIYEDIPATWWDRFVCSIHDRKWRNRTGPCSFYTEHEWSAKFEAADFEIVSQRRLSRLRNVSHPVSRNLYVLRLTRLTRDGSNGQRDGVVPGINDLAVPDSPDADSGERHGRIGCDAQMIACGRSTKIHERTLRAFRVRSCD